MAQTGCPKPTGGGRGRAQAYVIAVAGTSGAGKSTLVRAVTRRLGDAVSVSFDDYEQTSVYPPDWTAWLAAGGDPNRVATPGLAADLRALRSGQPVLHPCSRLPVGPAAYVVLDEPFGRARTEMRQLVDFVACLDVPLEIALARRVLRTLERVRDETRLREELRQIAESYLTPGAHELYLAATVLATADADLILDGTRDPEALAERVVQAIRARRRG